FPQPRLHSLENCCASSLSSRLQVRHLTIASSIPVPCTSGVRHPHASQPTEMGNHAFPERSVLGVCDLKVSTGLFHQLRDRRVVDVADPRKQMVLDLEVQAAEEPRHDPARP